jgi:microcompartment protein CcmL/EutN
LSTTAVEFLPHFADSPALGVLELASIARGVQVADAVVKKAPATLLLSRPVSGGKHIVMFRGAVAVVEESIRAGAAAAAEKLVDSLELPHLADQVWPLIYPGFAGHVRSSRWEADSERESVAIVETTTVCASIQAADAAAKVAAVALREMRLAVGIAGKAFFTMSGDLHDIEAAADRTRLVAGERLLELEVIAAPADEIQGRLIF